MISNEKSFNNVSNEVESLKLSNEKSKRIIDNPPKRLFEDVSEVKPIKLLIKDCLKD